MTEAPRAVVEAAEKAGQALAIWKSAPADRDHSARHAKADDYARQRRALDVLIEAWLADLATVAG